MRITDDHFLPWLALLFTLYFFVEIFIPTRLLIRAILLLIFG